MKDPMDVQHRFIVGSLPQDSDVPAQVDRVGGSLRTWEAEGSQDAIVVASVPRRHVDEIAAQLEPNPQVVDDEAEARAIAEASARGPGSPHEA